MVALCNRADHYISALWFLLSLWSPYGIGQTIIFSYCGLFFFFLLLFSLAYSQPPQVGCLPYFHTWCGLSAKDCWNTKATNISFVDGGTTSGALRRITLHMYKQRKSKITIYAKGYQLLTKLKAKAVDERPPSASRCLKILLNEFYVTVCETVFIDSMFPSATVKPLTHEPSRRADTRLV